MGLACPLGLPLVPLIVGMSRLEIKALLTTRLTLVIRLNERELRRKSIVQRQARQY
jgi:hypothetical protein